MYKLTDRSKRIQSSVVAGIVFLIGTVAMFLGKLTADYVALVGVVVVPYLLYKYKSKKLENGGEK